MILCGLGLPFPEEITLIAAGYTAATTKTVDIYEISAACGVAIMLGDAAPYVLGRVFGPKLLRLRLVRTWISTEALARFDRWFDRHGRLTVFVARFLTGIRVPAFFAAGSMRMSAWRFFIMDGLGVLISVPVFAGLGWYFRDQINDVIGWVEKAERVVLWSIIVGVVCAAGAWFWWHKRRSKRLLGEQVEDAFVGPPVAADAIDAATGDSVDSDGTGDASAATPNAEAKGASSSPDSGSAESSAADAGGAETEVGDTETEVGDAVIDPARQVGNERS